MSVFLAALRQIGLRVCRAVGMEIIDGQNGQPLGRALIVPWRGRLLLIGYEGSHPLRPVFRPQERLTYWKQELEFTVHPPPDFPHEPGA